MRVDEKIRRKAGVEDRTWSPPLAPEDADLRKRSFDWHRDDWPRWLMSPDGFAIGSRWYLKKGATIVVPEHCAYPTLALVRRGIDPGRYGVAAGTELTLVETYDPDADPQAQELDMVNYYMYVEGWATRTYKIEDGSCAGIRVWFSADCVGNRFPYSSRLAHAEIAPRGER